MVVEGLGGSAPAEGLAGPGVQRQRDGVEICRRSRNPAVGGVGVQVIPHFGVQVFPQWRGADERRGVHQFGSQHL